MAAEACTFENFWGESLVQYLPRLFRSTVEHARRLAARRTVGRRLLSSSSLQLVPLQLVETAAGHPRGHLILACNRMKIVENFWESHTRASPNPKDNAILRVGPGIVETHRVQWLEETEVRYWCSYFL